MTDDQLETLLRDTFRSREALVDPDVAQRVARSVRPPARRWSGYVAIAAAVVVVALVGAFLVSGAGTEDAPVADPGASSTVAGATYEGNRAVALAEAQRVVRLVPLPDGAVEGAESAWPGGIFGMAPSDPDLRQTVVWTVPTEDDVVGQYLRDHTLEDAHAKDAGSSSSSGGPMIPSLEYTVPSPAPDSMIGTTVMVQWVQDGDHTLVRADAFTAARSVRSADSLVPDDVTSVEVIDAQHPGDGPRGMIPTFRLTAEDDGPAIDALAAAVNGLPGSIRPVQVVGCPAMHGPPPTTTLTFHGPAGDLRFHLVDWCLGQVEVTRDGRTVSPTLDPGDLTEVVDSVVGRR